MTGITFSKKILYGTTIVVLVLTLFTLIMVWLTKDLSILNVLIPSWFTQFSVATGFYYNKAKAENLIKLRGHEIYEDLKDIVTDTVKGDQM